MSKATEQTKTETKTFDWSKVIAEHKTVSAAVKYLAKQGFTRSQIAKGGKNAKGGDLRYQHVRNILTQPAKKAATSNN